jgi:phospho-N-acetylmuramoyl-pentapeptide-transferase
LKEFQIGQQIRQEGPASHQTKAGTPTMGGLIILAGVLIPTLLWADLSNHFIWILIFAMLSFGAIGFIDDFTKVRKQQSLGLTAKHKFGLQIICSALIGCYLLYLSHYTDLYNTKLIFPFIKWLEPDIGLGTCARSACTGGLFNAVNLTMTRWITLIRVDRVSNLHGVFISVILFFQYLLIAFMRC